MTAPTIRWNVNADGDWATSADWKPRRLPASADDVAIDTADLHTITHGLGRDTVHTLTVGNDDFVVAGGSLRITSTASFAHGLTVSGGTLRLGGDATAARFSQSDTLRGPGTLRVAGSASLNGLQTGAGSTVLQGASTADLLALDGGRVLENQGILTLAGNGEIDLGSNPFGHTRGGAILINDAGATIDLTGVNHIGFVEQLPHGAVGVINAGRLEKTIATGSAYISVDLTNTGAVKVESGTLELDAGFLDRGAGTARIAAGATLRLGGGGSASARAFTVAAGGTLDFAGGVFAGAGRVFSLGAGRIGGAGTVAVTGGELALGTGAVTVGDFTQSGGAVSGTGVLTVDGSAALRGPALQSGGGVTVLMSISILNGGGLFLDGGRVLENRGDFTVTNGSLIELGGSPFGAGLGGGVVENDAGATVDLQGVAAIGAGAGQTGFVNAGTFEKSGGAGSALVDVAFTNNGEVVARAATLEFVLAIDGAGTMSVAGGATLETDASVAATQTVSFAGAGATLALGKARAFAATIEGFSAGDIIDLLGTRATRAVLESGDKLAIFNGSARIATLRLSGDYAGAMFDVASDGAHGTNITVTSAAAGAGHRFIAAMAGLGAGGGVGHVTGGARLDGYRSMLCAPKLAHVA